MPLLHTQAAHYLYLRYSLTPQAKHILFFLTALSLLLWNNSPKTHLTLIIAPAVSLPSTEPATQKPLPVDVQKTDLNDGLWLYARNGIHYLETSGKDVGPSFAHPGGFAFGPLGLSKVAVEDVLNRSEELRRYSMDDIFTKKELYETFARAYAALLLEHYLKIDLASKSKEEVFQILQKAWFLGPNFYLQGKEIVASRAKRAQEYLLLTKQ